MNEPAGQPAEGAVDRRLLRQTVVGLVLLVVVAGLLGWRLQEPISALSSSFIDRFGLAGLFLGVLITDSSPLPMTHEPILLVGISAGVRSSQLLAVAATASVLAGLVGYMAGALLVSRSRLRPWIEGRHPEFAPFMARHGVKGVAIAALLPIPFALATWSAGMMRIGLPGVAAACLLRVPKTAFYLWLIQAGWSVGTG